MGCSMPGSTVFHYYGLKHTSLPCPSLSPGVCSDSCPLWCYLTISLCALLPLFPAIFPSIKVFSNELALHVRWPKYWSFSFSNNPSKTYSGLISFRIDWLDILALKGTLKSLLQHHNLKASILPIVSCDSHNQRLLYSHWNKSSCFLGTFMLSPWSNQCWQADFLFVCLFKMLLIHLEFLVSHTAEA